MRSLNCFSSSAWLSEDFSPPAGFDSLSWADKIAGVPISNSIKTTRFVKPILIGLPPERGNAILDFRIVQNPKIETYQDDGKSRRGEEFS
jgi:hypothetical protein